MHHFATGAVAVALTVLALPGDLPAQVPNLVLPKASQRATVSQTIGFTEVSVTYDRPLVNKREIWGKLVPYDSVWRAGANENTVIAFSSPVRVGGQDLPAGRYGVHMIPTAKEWTVILSKQADAWGSFSYDPKEDAARFSATPTAAPFQEALGYTFDDPGAGSVVATLRWEKLARAVQDRNGPQAGRSGQPAPTAPRSRPVLLAALEPGRRVVRAQRREPGGGRGMGPELDRDQRELHQPADEGRRCSRRWATRPTRRRSGAAPSSSPPSPT